MYLLSHFIFATTKFIILSKKVKATKHLNFN